MSDRLRTGKKQHAPLPFGAYFTEPHLVRALLPFIAHLRGQIIDEPCCGDGAIARLLEADGHVVRASDLVDRGYGRPYSDFFACRATIAAAVVSNFPYHDAAHGFECHAEMARHAIRLMAPNRGLVAALMPEDFGCAEGRYDLLTGPPYAFKLTCMWRPVWIRGTAGGGRTSSAWFCWDWRHKGPARDLYVRRPA